MKFLIVNLTYRPHYGGVENSIHYIGRYLLDSNHEVKILTSNRGLERNAPLRRVEVIDNITTFRYKRVNLRSSVSRLLAELFDILGAYHATARIQRYFSPDVIIVRDMKTGLGAVLAAPSAYSYYIMPSLIQNESRVNATNNGGNTSTVRIVYKSIKQALTVLQQQVVQNILIRIVSKNVVFSENMAVQAQLAKIVGVNNYAIIPPGVDSDLFVPNPLEKKRFRLKYSIGKQDMLVVVVGRIVAAKGIDILLRALPLCNNPNIKILIVGDGPEVESLSELSSNLNIADRVIFQPGTKRPEKYYQVADIFALPSRYETFGQTILEALSSGLPILAFDSRDRNVHTATAEIMLNDINGILVDYSEEGLAHGLNTIASFSKNKMESITNTNRQLAKTRYPWSRITEYLAKNASGWRA
jgi:1,2-diacylglycerol 3-alpha-glucosyltransferase